MADRVVITHPKLGVYLGSFMGLGFWTLLDPAGQPAAVTFGDESEAREHVGRWGDNGVKPDVQYVPVKADGYASVSDLKRAGLGDLLGDMERDALMYAAPAGSA